MRRSAVQPGIRVWWVGKLGDRLSGTIRTKLEDGLVLVDGDDGVPHRPRRARLHPADAS